jgi:serine/threonine protein kinase
MILLLKGKILNDRYRITQSLGQGGYGAVYLAEDLDSGRMCAIKENLDDSPDNRTRFLQEASILYNLHHPNLPEVWDHFVIPGEGQYLVMEFVEGLSLIEILENEGKPLPEFKIVNWIAQVCDALAYLHSQNPPIIHRDIKPGNIRISPQGKAILVDFGIAKVYDEFSRTSTYARAITPGYSPLEQYGLARTDGRSDVYALGATAYKLLTNIQPEPSVDIAAGTARSPKLAHEINPKVSREVSLAIGRAMQLKIDQRTPSITQFKNEIMRSPVVRQSHKDKDGQPPTHRYYKWVYWLIGILLVLGMLFGAYLIYYLLWSYAF